MKGFMFSQTRLMLLLSGILVTALIGYALISDDEESLSIKQHTPAFVAQIDTLSNPYVQYRENNATQSEAPKDEEYSEEVYLPYVQVFFDPLIKSLLTAQVSTPIVSINKRLGDSFAANETLIQLYDVVYKAGVKKGEGLVQKAQIGLTAKLQLFEDGVASLFDVADFQSALASANFDLASAAYLYDCCTIDVPYPGYVSAVLVNDFETPQVGQPMIEVVDTRVLLAKMLFDSTYIDKIFVGQKIRISVRETGETVDGKIIRIAPAIDPASAKFKVEAEVPNVNGKIRPGMSGKITLSTLAVKHSEIPSGGQVQ